MLGPVNGSSDSLSGYLRSQLCVCRWVYRQVCPCEVRYCDVYCKTLHIIYAHMQVLCVLVPVTRGQEKKMISTSLGSPFYLQQYCISVGHGSCFQLSAMLLLSLGLRIMQWMKYIKVVPSKHFVLSDIFYNMKIRGRAVLLWAKQQIQFLPAFICLSACLSMFWRVWLFFSWTNFTEPSALLLFLPTHKIVM